MLNMVTTDKIDIFLKEKFADIDSKIGIYSNSNSNVQPETVTPRERIHEMFVKRLYDNNLHISLTHTKEIGHIQTDNPIVINSEELDRNGYRSVVTYTSNSGATGRLDINWIDRLLKVETECEPAHDDMGVCEPTTIIVKWYCINQFIITSMHTPHGYTCDIGLLLDITPYSNDSVRKNSVHDYMGVNKQYVVDGVLSQSFGEGFMLTNPTTFREIAEITGVPASTLSNLRNQKKSIDNLAYTTLSVLSQYGQLKYVDGFIYEAYKKYYESGISATELERLSYANKGLDSKRYCVVYEMLNGREYVVNFASQNDAETEYNLALMSINFVSDKTDNNSDIIHLRNVLVVDIKAADDSTGIIRAQCGIRKSNIDTIYMEYSSRFSDATS